MFLVVHTHVAVLFDQCVALQYRQNVQSNHIEQLQQQIADRRQLNVEF